MVKIKVLKNHFPRQIHIYVNTYASTYYMQIIGEFSWVSRFLINSTAQDVEMISFLPFSQDQ